jgi:transcription initiation factor TFIIB
MTFMEMNDVSLIPNHHFCLKCDKKEFCYSEINENLVIDYRAGDLICGQCGEILSDRLINSCNEEITYAEDAEIGQNRSRTSGHSEFFGSQESVFVCGPTELRKSLQRAQMLTASRKEKVILANIVLVNELCSKLNLNTTIKVS